MTLQIKPFLELLSSPKFPGILITPFAHLPLQNPIDCSMLYGESSSISLSPQSTHKMALDNEDPN